MTVGECRVPPRGENGWEGGIDGGANDERSWRPHSWF